MRLLCLFNSTQTHLFHEQEDVCLGCFQHVSVRMLQAFHCQTHCPAINVDPAGGTGGQEGPEHTDTPDQYHTAWLTFEKGFRFTYSVWKYNTAKITIVCVLKVLKPYFLNQLLTLRDMVPCGHTVFCQSYNRFGKVCVERI